MKSSKILFLMGWTGLVTACSVPSGVTRDAQSEIRTADQACQAWMFEHHQYLKHLDHLQVAPKDSALNAQWKPISERVERAYWACRQAQDAARQSMLRSEQEVQNALQQSQSDSALSIEAKARLIRQKFQPKDSLKFME
jgi:hypothetical protein